MVIKCAKQKVGFQKTSNRVKTSQHIPLGAHLKPFKGPRQQALLPQPTEPIKRALCTLLGAEDAPSQAGAEQDEKGGARTPGSSGCGTDGPGFYSVCQ